MVRVVKIDRRYFYTKYMVKIQVFNDMCQEPHCEGPISDEVEIMSAEDLPQVINVYNWKLVYTSIIKLIRKLFSNYILLV